MYVVSELVIGGSLFGSIVFLLLGFEFDDWFRHRRRMKELELKIQQGRVEEAKAWISWRELEELRSESPRRASLLRKINPLNLD